MSSTTSAPVILSRKDSVTEKISFSLSPPDDAATVPPPPPLVDVEDLIGRTFLTDVASDGQKHRAKIARLVDDFDSSVERVPE
jgi:hypothetical protein